MIRTTRVMGCILLAGAGAFLAGCSGQKDLSSGQERNPALRRMETPPGGTQADADRAALARFVGVWTFEGWSTDTGGVRTPASGDAAAVIENEHFVKIDVVATSGKLGGRAGRKGGSLLLASEPGVGVTLTSWGDASPSISRLIGRSEGEGSQFTFQEARTPEGVRAVSLKVTFETDDRWLAQVSDASTPNGPVVASYTFTRVQNSGNSRSGQSRPDSPP